jgi:hypothetical protein
MELKTVIVEIAAPSEEFLMRLLRVLDTIEYLGDVGASRNLEVMVDGDGAARFQFRMWENLAWIDLPKTPEIDLDKDTLQFDLG